MECTNVLDKPWAPDVDHGQKSCYQPLVDFTYWYMLGTFNNCNIVQFTNKNASSEDFDEVNKIFLLDQFQYGIIGTYW